MRPMGTHETQRDYRRLMRPMGTHETQIDYWDTHETNDLRDSERLMETNGDS